MLPKATVDRTPPSLFRPGLSPLSKLLLMVALSILLMVLDAKLQLVAPIRSAIATTLMPLQWLALTPVRLLSKTSSYFSDLQSAQDMAVRAQTDLVRQAQRAAQVEHLSQENQELRSLLGIRHRLPVPTQGVEVLYATLDPYARKLVVDHGESHGIQLGSPVMDGHGIVGQVTRVYPLVAEITLLTDKEQMIPVLNARTGQRSIAYGLPRQGLLELRFIPAITDIEVGDLLTTNGTAGIYPAGLPVARVQSITRQGESGFASVLCEPIARMEQNLHLLVLEPMSKPAGIADAKANLTAPPPILPRPRHNKNSSTEGRTP